MSLKDIQEEVMSRRIFSEEQFIFYTTVIAIKYNCYFTPIDYELFVDARGNPQNNLERIKNAQKDICQVCAGLIAKSIVDGLEVLYDGGLLNEALKELDRLIFEYDMFMAAIYVGRSVEP